MDSFENELTQEQLKESTINALQNAFEVCKKLGERGLEAVQKNQFGETALRIDIEAEKAVIDSFSKDNIPVRIISEEHGVIDIGTPRFLAVLDGIDGTALYKKDPLNGKYGTMLGLFEGMDPAYRDYIFSGIMQHATGRIFVGERGKGAYTILKDFVEKVKTSGHTNLDKQTKIYIDEYFDINKETFSKPFKEFNTDYQLASSLYYADLAEGLADAVLECTRKDNLEIATAYGLIKEAGGAMMDIDGNDMGNHKYLEFGKNKQIPVITAASKDLAIKILNSVKK